MQTMEGRQPTTTRFRNPWRRYGRLVATNFLRGASYALGTAVIGLAAWWAQNR
ncbi:hypothetical protein K2224_18725 [Streptomyces sp. BHT-5-2]|uniref:hypothetical protein n=1 Tax=unclassified Streptomyces TaxID=2593676 RepID=UPI00036F22E5|nr:MULTISPECIES: hypothetical protein [unclassified Streptomyces]QZL04928.1 hypothetical protein K2224_18725 [Streptomyces sp. BHT-5-2]